MSRINFDTLADEVPHYRQAWSGLRDWFRRNPGVSTLNLRKLSRDLRDVNTQELALALTEMATRHLLRPVYFVLTPDGNLLEGEFDSPKDVPPQLPDRRHHSFIDTADADIILGYRVESGRVK